MRYTNLDRQLAAYAGRLSQAVGLDEREAATVATLIAAEVRFLEPASRAEVLAASPVPLQARLDELRAFQAWMEAAANISGNPAVTRAQVITQNYVCFVYLGEACFLALRKFAKAGSVTRRCCKFLTDNPVRAFRNAIAHSNWTYSADFSGLVFWAKKGAERDEPLAQFEVGQDELGFWQALSRCVAYAAYSSIETLQRPSGE